LPRRECVARARGGGGFIHWVAYNIPATRGTRPSDRVYALDVPSIDDAGTPMTWRKLRFIIHDHVLAKASLTGLRGH